MMKKIARISFFVLFVLFMSSKVLAVASFTVPIDESMPKKASFALQLFNCTNIVTPSGSKEPCDIEMQISYSTKEEEKLLLSSVNLKGRLEIANRKTKDATEFCFDMKTEQEKAYQIRTKQDEKSLCVYFFDVDNAVLGKNVDFSLFATQNENEANAKEEIATETEVAETIGANDDYLKVNFSSVAKKVKNQIQVFNNSATIQGGDFVVYYIDSTTKTWECLDVFPLQQGDSISKDILQKDILQNPFILIEPLNKNTTYNCSIDTQYGNLVITISDTLAKQRSTKGKKMKVATKYDIKVKTDYPNKDVKVTATTNVPPKKFLRNVAGFLGLKVKIENGTEKVIKTKFEYSSVLYNEKTYLPFCDGQRVQDVGVAAPPDKITPPKLQTMFDFLSAGQIKGSSQLPITANNAVFVLCLEIEEKQYFWTMAVTGQ